MLPINHPIYERINNAIEYFSKNKISITKCAKMFNIHRETLAKYLNIYNIHEDRRKYDIDENFFEVINTEEKAYWLGFLTADGCIKSNSNQISLGLSIKDYSHLEKFKKSLKSTKSIIIEKSLSGFNKDYECCYFRVNNKKIYQDLIDLGFTSNKTFNEIPADIPSNLRSHYIRGIFDGDGWISFNDRHSELGFGMGYDILNYIKNTVENEIDINKKNIFPYKSIYRYRIQGNKQVKMFLDYLYKDATIYLDRKYEKYLEYCRSKMKLQKS